MMEQNIEVEQDGSAFFMTNCLEPQFHRQTSKTNYIEPQIDIEKWFQSTAQTLKHRRQLNIRQSQRIREIQQQYQRRQFEKKKILTDKLSASQSIKQKNVNQIRQRLRRLSERRNKVFDKVRAEDRQQLNKQLRDRKSFEIHSNGTSYSLNSSKSKLSSSKERIKKVELQIKIQQGRIDDKLDQMQSKQKKALKVCHEFHSQKANRARSHNSIEVPQVKKKAYLVLNDTLQNKSQQALRKLHHVDIVRRNKEKHISETNNKKSKSFSEKLHRFHNNVLQLEQAKRRKDQILDQKYAKTFTKHYPDPRATIQSKRLIQNLDAIQKSQKIKAQRVMIRHRQIQARNKIIRERKDRLYKNYTNQTIQ